MFFNQNTVNTALIKQLNASSLRQRVIADNIANINTPNYKRSEVKFEDALKKAMGPRTNRLLTSHPRHLSSNGSIKQLEPEVVKVENTTMRSGGNNVSIEQEMVNLAKNTLVFRTAAEALGSRKSITGYVIRGGR